MTFCEEMSSNTPFRFRTRIRYIDTDQSGRIHYTAMFRYFESAEIEFMRELGITYRSGSFNLPRVHVECDYKRAVNYDDDLEIEVALKQLGRSSMRFEFCGRVASEIVAQGAVVIACMNWETQRASPIPEEMRRKLEGVLQHERLNPADKGA